MQKIIVTNRIDRIRRHPAIGGDNAGFIVLEESRVSFSVRDYLAGTLRMREITKREMTDTIGADFKLEFSKAMRGLNRNNGSLWWWSMNFTNKLPLMSRLYENAFYFVVVKKIVSDYTDITLIVVSDNDVLAGQLAAWTRLKGIGFERAIAAPFSLKNFLKRHTPFMIKYMFFKLLARKAVSNILLEKPSEDNAERTVIITQFEPRCIDKNGNFRDIYLGEIKRLLAGLPSMEKASFVTIGFSPYSFMGFITKLGRKGKDKGIYPAEYFLSVKDLVSVFFGTLSRSFRSPEFAGVFSVFGEDASYLVESEIRESVSSGQMLLNLSFYAALGSFSKKFRARAVYYPFENRSWEKMMLLAFRENSPSTKIVGHQHTIITEKHLNFFLEKDEPGEIPMPDRIVTDGEITKEMMRKWNFPEGILKTGCALRFSMPDVSVRGGAPKGVKNVLIVLASGMGEYIKMMMFLEEAFKGGAPYKITIRPHPAIPFNDALKVFAPKGFRYDLSRSSLKEDLERSDIVIYASSTVSLEAISVGKPAVCLKLDDFLSSDPMFDNDMLKWLCSDPGKLSGLIETVANIKEDEISKMRRSARKYAERYFYPINKDNLTGFIV